METREQPGAARSEEKVQIFTIDGVEVSAPICDHCGEKPTEADAAELVKEITDPVCAMCRNQIAPTKLTLTHFGDDKWGWAQITYEERVSMQLWFNHGSAYVDCHRTCAADAFPYFYGEAGTQKS